MPGRAAFINASARFRTVVATRPTRIFGKAMARSTAQRDCGSPITHSLRLMLCLYWRWKLPSQSWKRRRTRSWSATVRRVD